MPAKNIQETFINSVKEKLPSGISLAEEIADLLNISTDSAYRRIRGETLLTIDEFLILSSKFNISLDGLAGHSGDYVTFRHLAINYQNYTIESLFQIILTDFEQASKVENSKLIYLARDIPIFYLLQFPEIRAFKIFLWQNLHHDPNLSVSVFKPEEVDKEMMKLGRKIWDNFVRYPSIEIWGVPTFESLVDEIGFMWESSQIADKEIGLTLCDAATNLVMHIKTQAELGYKFSYDLEPIEREDNFKLYCTDLFLTHNKVLVDGDIKRVYIPTTLDTLITSDRHYFDRNYELLLNLTTKSNLISKTGEKERNRFIQTCLNKVEVLRKKIQNS